MARIRSVHPGLFTDEAFVSVSPTARLLLIGLWTEADDRGIFEWKPLRLRMRLFGGDDYADVSAWLAELVGAGSIKQFTVDGKDYGAVRNFCKWQRPRAPEFVHPSGDMDEYVGLNVRAEREQTDRGTALGKIVADRDGHCCRYCGNGVTPYRKKVNSLEIDHVIPISRGGTDDLANLAAACKPCNQRKANMTESEFFARFAQSELYEFSVSRIGKHISQSAKTVSQDEFPPNAESSTQMEDGGWRMEDGIGGGKERKEDSRLSDFDDMHDARAVFDTWNMLAADLKLPRAQHFSELRQKHIRRRLSDLGGLEGWYALLDRVRASQFLQGGTDANFQATFDWLLKPSNLTKVMEGNYDDRRPANSIQSAIDDLPQGL